MIPTEKTTLLILGVHLSSDGYPNVKYRIDGLRNISTLNIVEINYPMWKTSTSSKKFTAFRSFLRAIWAHCLVLYQYIMSRKNAKTIYIPYPGVFVCLALSFLPKKFKPSKIILDAFISLYDTIVIDRELINKSHWAAKLLKHIEQRSYQYADIIITDTKQNSKYLAKLLNIPKTKFVDIPLSTNELDFEYSPYKPTNNTIQILFIGTLIPLHGIDVILGSIRFLKDNKQLHFTLIGDGQKALEIENFIEEHPNLITWVREWQPAEALNQFIRDADICLGIFGTGAKTQRVCPLKIYAYAACGRAIITAETDWYSDITQNTVKKPFSAIPVGNSLALAKEITKLAGSVEMREDLAKMGHTFYKNELCNQIAMNTLVRKVL